jgi:DNA-binding Xre family transcriptional regulator
MSAEDFRAKHLNDEDLSAEEKAELAEWTRNLKRNLQRAKVFIDARQAKGLTQTQLAEIVGMNQAEISRLEGEKGNPRLSTLNKICDALDLEISFQPVSR